MRLSSLMFTFVFCTAAYYLFIEIKEKKSSIKYYEIEDHENIAVKIS